jgi:hypothetical protein
MNLLNKQNIIDTFKNKRVVIFGSAPNCLNNKGSEIDKYDYIIRVNNYKIKGFEEQVGTRTDVHYAFYGSSIKISKEALKQEGMKFHMCKCPNAFCFNHNVDWDPHNRGSDFRWIYRNRKNYWIAPVYVPTKEDFMKYFNMLDGHVPTTGFSCILDLMQCGPKELYITGFDGFKTKIHNVNERWRDKSNKRQDPIAHQPEKEMMLLNDWQKKYNYIRLQNG